MLNAVAVEIAESLALDRPLQVGEPSRWLYNELLAHSEDESEAVAAECLRLRVDLAAALRAALARWPQAECLLLAGPSETSSAPPVRAEVRGTAGRTVIFDSFTIGSAPVCDVQAFGDDTVRPLHCVVISMPGGVVVADFRPEAAEKAFVVLHGERLTLHIGDKTTVGLGPDARRARRRFPARARSGCCRASAREARGAATTAAAPKIGSPSKAGARSQGSTTFVSTSRASSLCSSRSRSPRRRGAGGPLFTEPLHAEVQ
jgi:hypothetical protein